mgnify:CR=1 FL=1
MNPTQHWFLRHSGIPRYLHEEVERRRQVILKGRGVELGLLGTLKFWEWRQTQGWAPWNPYPDQYPSDTNILEWWSKFEAHVVEENDEVENLRYDKPLELPQDQWEKLNQLLGIDVTING